MMKRRPGATRPNGVQKRRRWSGNSGLARNPATLPLLDVPEKVRETHGKHKQRNNLPSARRLEGLKLSQWKRQRQINIVANNLRRGNCMGAGSPEVCSEDAYGQSRMQASLRKRRGASYSRNHQNGHPGLHPQPLKTNFQGTRPWAAHRHRATMGHKAPS